MKMPKKKSSYVPWILMILGGINIVYGLATREIWGISKIQGTPSWLAICTGIGLILFVIFYYIADIKKQVSWAKFIAPAGTATLTCYMLPYFIYPLRAMSGIHLPELLTTSWLGLLMSFVFSLFVVGLTGIFEKKGFEHVN